MQNYLPFSLSGKPGRGHCERGRRGKRHHRAVTEISFLLRSFSRQKESPGRCLSAAGPDGVLLSDNNSTCVLQIVLRIRRTPQKDCPWWNAAQNILKSDYNSVNTKSPESTGIRSHLCGSSCSLCRLLLDSPTLRPLKSVSAPRVPTTRRCPAWLWGTDRMNATLLRADLHAAPDT